MIDFTMRECPEVVDGQICFIRLGTCGTPNKDVKLGTVVIQKDSIMIKRNPNGFRKNSKEKKYLVSDPVEADPGVTNEV